jgi:hypothetical protein
MEFAVVVAARNVTVNSSLLNSRSKARLYEPSGKFMVAASGLHKHRRMGALKSFSALEQLCEPVSQQNYPDSVGDERNAHADLRQHSTHAASTPGCCDNMCLVGSCLQQEDPPPARWAIHLSKRCREFRQLPTDQSRRAGATTAHLPAAGLVSRSTSACASWYALIAGSKQSL